MKKILLAVLIAILIMAQPVDAAPKRLTTEKTRAELRKLVPLRNKPIQTWTQNDYNKLILIMAVKDGLIEPSN